ncbi:MULTISPECIES: VWA domain-containing protein [Pseudomonas]|uniref:VWA domain-containing protein n=1 Tax=Pseudomonas TaxID=286 RepID=UPI000F03E928|nr:MULTISPECIES: VWA domain-containing protein [Pseudomonas]MBD8615131.1 VWA domain-containing protein [Pseudomonas putida]MBD8681194.1 VWA domain-containing protein [Pseudomonas sp. CFBP 13719]
MRISLSKVEQEAPELVSAYKQTKISLAKHEHLRDHIARVALVLDISASMSGLYNSGLVDRLVAKAMPVGLQFDDDGEIDVFAFGVDSYEIASYGMADYKGCVSSILERHNLEGGTRYARALELLEAKYANSTDPVYVIFVTDGDTEQADKVSYLIRKMSKLPIFIQFVGLGEQIPPEGFDIDGNAEPAPAKKAGFFARLLGASGSTASASSRRPSTSGFKYLCELDSMGGREVDNCNFFALKDPASVSDERFYELLMNEYPSWVKEAKSKGILN